MATSLTTELARGPDTDQRSCSRQGTTFTGPDEFVPNCLINTTTAYRLASPSLTLSTDDCAMETWLLPFGPGPNTDSLMSLRYSNSVAFGITIDLNVAGAGAFVNTRVVRIIPPGGGFTGAQVACEAGWHHYAVNFDRNGNAELFIDGVSQDTVAIGAGAADNFPGTTPFEMGANSNGVTCIGMGPTAYHIGTLLTGAQMAASRANRYVRNLAQTVGLWDFRTIVGQTGWDSDTTHFPVALYSQGVNTDIEVPIPFACPEGANGTVTVEDRSGSGNALSVTTDTAYTTANTQGVMFGTDPFFK